jgi:uncharacterized membrane protein YfcA
MPIAAHLDRLLFEPAGSPVATLFLLVAGVAAAVVGTAGGITSLISYPALLAVGLSPLRADVANIVALAACWPGAAVASRAELSGSRPWLRRWAPLTGLATACGAALLLLTPPGAFADIVPFLVLASAVALIAEPRFARRRQPGATAPRPLLPAGIVAAGIYGGYFGAGSGVMILALLLATVEGRLTHANALKNMLVGATSVVGGIAFVIVTSVNWEAVIPLGIGELIGATLGPRVTRRLPPGLMRALIVLIALALAAELWASPHA